MRIWRYVYIIFCVLKTKKTGEIMGALASVGESTKTIKPSLRRKARASKKKRLEKALRKERDKSKEYLNRLMYLQAEFENYRKRTEKRMNELVLFGNERLIANLLSVIDELELAIQAGRKTKKKRPLIEGVVMALKNMYTTLGREGLTEIEAVGKPFDPNKHEAVSKVATKECAEGTVIEEVRKGFMLRDRVIRPSMVKVAILPNHQNFKPQKKVVTDE